MAGGRRREARGTIPGEAEGTGGRGWQCGLAMPREGQGGNTEKNERKNATGTRPFSLSLTVLGVALEPINKLRPRPRTLCRRAAAAAASPPTSAASGTCTRAFKHRCYRPSAGAKAGGPEIEGREGEVEG